MFIYCAILTFLSKCLLFCCSVSTLSSISCWSFFFVNSVSLMARSYFSLHSPPDMHKHTETDRFFLSCFVELFCVCVCVCVEQFLTNPVLFPSQRPKKCYVLIKIKHSHNQPQVLSDCVFVFYQNHRHHCPSRR